jgi:hypothetical protein
MLKGMNDKLNEIGRRYGMEINVEKTKITRISGQQTTPSKNYEQK